MKAAQDPASAVAGAEEIGGDDGDEEPWDERPQDGGVQVKGHGTNLLRCT